MAGQTMTINELRQFVDKTITLHLTNGEIAKVKVLLIDEEYKDLIVDVLETSSLERYRDPSAAYTFAASDIASADPEP